jgi:hypothetical protein
MSRAFKAMAILCVASLLGNVWLYRELKLSESAELRRVAALPPRAQSRASEPPVVEATAAKTSANSPKPSAQQAADKCRKKWEDELRRQLHDPQQHEKLKQQEIAALQAMNISAATRLHLNEQTYNRILELQAEQNLTERAASIGTVGLPTGVSLNSLIAEEFGDAVAVKWLDYQRQSSGRAAVRGVANLFADAAVPLSEDQRQRLIGVYAEAFEMQSAQDSAPDMRQSQENLRNPRAMEAWWGKLLARQVSFDQRVQVDSASFLTPAQLELLQKKADVDAERFRSVIEIMPKAAEVSTESPEPSFEC